MDADFFLDGALPKLGILSVIIPAPHFLRFKQKTQNLWTIPGRGLGNRRGKELDERKSPGGVFVVNPLIKNTKQGREGSISAS